MDKIRQNEMQIAITGVMLDQAANEGATRFAGQFFSSIQRLGQYSLSPGSLLAG